MVHAAASSSASVSSFLLRFFPWQGDFLELSVVSVKQVGTDCVEITSSEGPVFFVRTSYLQSVSPDALTEGALFDESQAEDIVRAGEAFAVEKKCEGLLARCEQCRAGLERKMQQKGFSKEAVSLALDYLEGRNFLSDERFASSWLRIHAVNKYQGRSRLTSELLSRGISRSITSRAVDEFFTEHDEEEFCRKAVEKAARAGRTGDKLIKYLLDSGFSYRMIQNSLQ